MGFDIRLPNIDAQTTAEKQIKSYLIQMAEMLNWALQNADTSNNTVVVAPTSKSLPSPVQTPVSAEATFGAIKALIIKSADIVNAYSEEISKRLEGVYVAESEFGTFREQTSQDIVENSTNVNRTFNHIQEIKSGVDSSLGELDGKIGDIDTKVDGVKTGLSSDIDTLKNGLQTVKDSLVEVTANTNSGLLYYDADGVPVYGFEVGQKNIIDGVEVFNKFARFTSGRLSFYDQNGSEVAYISDYKLYITHAEVTGTLKIGGYLVDTTNGVTFRWVGRG